MRWEHLKKKQMKILGIQYWNYYLLRYFVRQANLGLTLLGVTFYQSKKTEKNPHLSGSNK